MPQLSKKRKAAFARQAARKAVREAAKASMLNNPSAAGAAGHWVKQFPEEDDGLIPTEPVVDVHVKQELLELAVNPFAATEQLEPEIKVEVEVELLEPDESDPIAGELKTEDDLPAITLADPDVEITCHFCLRPFRETVGRGVITRNRIAFVLGVKKWNASHKHLDCCKDCKKMFDLFNDFKRSCLMALARPLFLSTCAEKKVATDVIDLRPKNFRMKRKKRPPLERSEGERDEEVEMPRSESLLVVPPGSNENSDVDEEVNPNEPDADGTNTNPSSSDEMAPNEGKDNAVSQPKAKKERKYCYRCKQFYASEAIYLDHKPTCKKPTREPAFECSICSKRLTSSTKLMYHMHRHNGVRTVPCRREGCTKMYFDTKNRHAHEQYCGQVVPIQEICNVCGAVFRSKAALRAHLPSHEEPTVVCEVCNKAFHTRAKLKKHMSVHSDARNFECKVCGKRFKSHEANRVHQRIHTQEKPYVCHICGMAFTYNCLLKTHLEKGHDVADSNQNQLMGEASRASLAWPSGGY